MWISKRKLQTLLNAVKLLETQNATLMDELNQAKKWQRKRDPKTVVFVKRAPESRERSNACEEKTL